MTFPHHAIPPWLASVLLLCCCALSAPGAVEEEEQRRARAQDEVWQQVIPVYSFAAKKANLFDFRGLSIEVREGPSGTAAIALNLRLRSSTLPLIFSFFIENRIYGSPGLDGFALPRTSLNKDPVTGWFYWDF